jgi:hypothetical protein
MAFLTEFWGFLMHRRKYWLWPLFIILALLGFLVVMAQGSVLAPFIYSLF